MLDSKFTPDQILRIGDALAKLQAAEIGARQKVLALRARVRELESAHMNYDRAQGAHMHVLGAGQGQVRPLRRIQTEGALTTDRLS
jgi:UTP:GlnB (protein PII) uridylyltransferase